MSTKLEAISCEDALALLEMCGSCEDPILWRNCDTTPRDLIQYGEVVCDKCGRQGSWDYGELPNEYGDAAAVPIKFYPLLDCSNWFEGTLLDMVMDRLGIEWA